MRRKLSNEGDIDRDLDTACSLFYSGQPLEAIRIVKSVLENGYKPAYANYLLGEFSLELKEFGKAVGYYNAGLEIDRFSPSCRLGLASMYLNGYGVPKDRPKAIKLLQEADRDPGVSILIGLIRLKGSGIKSNPQLAKFNFLKAYSMGNLIGYRLLSRVFWMERKFFRAIWIEIRAFTKILPVYLRNRQDIRIWAPWLDWTNSK